MPALPSATPVAVLSLFLALAVAPLLAHARAAHAAAAATLSSPWAAPTFGSLVSVLDYGAVGDGVTDNTAAFAAAIAALQGRGGTVLVPSGAFAFDGSLELPEGTALVGTYAAVPSHDLRPAKALPVDGSQLYVRGGQGNENGTAFVTVGGNAAIKGFTFFYPAQTFAGPPMPFPWTISLKQGSNNAAVMDVELLNSWNGVQAVGAARHYIARVQGQPANIGILVDQTYDIGRIENVHWNPWFSSEPTYLAHQDVFGRGFVFARTDWEYVLNTFVFSMSLGYHFIESPEGACNGNFVGIGADSCQNASVLIDDSDVFGVLIVNGEFTSFANSPFGPNIADHTQVVVSETNKGSVRITNSAFWGPSFSNVRSYAGKISVSDCVFDAWDANKTGTRASIEVFGGQAQVRGNEFHLNHGSAPQVLLQGPSANGAGVTKAIITDNLVDGVFTIVNNAPTAKLATANNVDDS